MKGQREAVAAGLAAARAGRPGMLVTVVNVEGSAYRRPGARMFLPLDGEPVGLVSGGCLESDLAERASAVLADCEPRTVLYDMRSPDDLVWGLGLGCNGSVRVLLEPIVAGAPPADLRFLAACAASRRAGVVVTVFDVHGGSGSGSSSGSSSSPESGLDGPPRTAPRTSMAQRMLVDAGGDLVQALPDAAANDPFHAAARRALAERRSRVVRADCPGGAVEALVEFVEPAIRLIVFGAGLDAQPVVEQAAALGWHVRVLDHRPAYAMPERFPLANDVRVAEWSRLGEKDVPLDARTATVLMTHHFLHDVEILSALARRAPAYVGLLGPRRRMENLVAELTRRGIPLSDDLRGRVHGPVGLDVGSETPEEIALSLAAEIQAVFAGRDGGMLRERVRPLHDWAS